MMMLMITLLLRRLMTTTTTMIMMMMTTTKMTTILMNVLQHQCELVFAFEAHLYQLSYNYLDFSQCDRYLLYEYSKQMQRLNPATSAKKKEIQNAPNIIENKCGHWRNKSELTGCDSRIVLILIVVFSDGRSN